MSHRSFGHATVLAFVVLSFSIVQAQTGAPEWNRRIGAVAVTPSETAPGTFDVSVAWDAELLQPAPTFLDLSTEIVVLVNGVEIDVHAVPLHADPGSGPSPTGACLDCTGTCQGSCGSGMGTQWFCVKDAFCTVPGGAEDCRCVTPGPPDINNLLTTAAASLQPGDEIMILLRPAPGALPDSDTTDDIRIIAFDGDSVGWDRRIVDAGLVARDSFFDVWIEYDFVAFGQQGQTLGAGSQIELWVNGILFATHTSCTDRLTAGNPCDGAVCGGSCGTSTCNGTDTPAVCVPGDANNVPGCICSTGTLSHTFPLLPIDPDDDDLVIKLKPVPGALPELPGFEEEDTEDCHGMIPEALMEKAGQDIDLDWDDSAPTYDVVRGDLALLRAGAGDFTAATEDCESNDLPVSILTTGGDPAPGEGHWFLIRPNPCNRPTTYDTGSASQIESRDAEIEVSGLDCAP